MGITRRRFVSSSVLLVSAAAVRLPASGIAEAACLPAVIPDIRIRRIEVETWTGRGEHDRTGDPFECRIHFGDGRSFRQTLDNPEINDREVGQRDRFRLDLTTAQAASAVSGQMPGAIRALEIRKTGGSNAWVCEAVGLRVNDVVILSRYVANGRLENANESFRVDLRTDGGLDGMELRVRTANAAKGQTDDAVYCNVVFEDGTLLYPEVNLPLNVGEHINDFVGGDLSARAPEAGLLRSGWTVGRGRFPFDRLCLRLSFALPKDPLPVPQMFPPQRRAGDVPVLDVSHESCLYPFAFFRRGTAFR